MAWRSCLRCKKDGGEFQKIIKGGTRCRSPLHRIDIRLCENISVELNFIRIAHCGHGLSGRDLGGQSCRMAGGNLHVLAHGDSVESRGCGFIGADVASAYL